MILKQFNVYGEVFLKTEPVEVNGMLCRVRVQHLDEGRSSGFTVKPRYNRLIGKLVGRAGS